MNKSSSLLAVAAFTLLAATGARAESPDVSGQFAQAIDGQRTRAEVMAEAATVAKNRNPEPAGSRVAAIVKSNVSPAAVKAEAAQALRLGQIPRGELSL